MTGKTLARTLALAIVALFVIADVLIRLAQNVGFVRENWQTIAICTITGLGVTWGIVWAVLGQIRYKGSFDVQATYKWANTARTVMEIYLDVTRHGEEAATIDNILAVIPNKRVSLMPWFPGPVKLTNGDRHGFYISSIWVRETCGQAWPRTPFKLAFTVTTTGKHKIPISNALDIPEGVVGL